MKSTYASLTAVLTLLATPAAADTPDIFGRTGIYDLTGHPEIADIRIDQSFVMGGEPADPALNRLKGAPTVEVRENFLYVHDADGQLTIPPRSGRDLGEYFQLAATELYRVLPDEFVFLILFTTFDANVGAFFYSPEANDTRGLGSQVFDSNGSSPREGIVFMNYYRAVDELYGQLGLPQPSIDAQRRSIFNQEVGHRWGSFVTVGGGPNGSGDDILLGRDDGHWSYFAHTGGSPMEGNDWADNGNGTFTTRTGVDNYIYSDLDLYLMGMLAPTEVAPWFVIDNVDVGGARDLSGRTVNRASPPQFISSFRGGAVTVSGTRVDMTVQNIINRAGNRVPNADDAPRSFRTAIVFLGGQSTPASEPVKQQFGAMVDNVVAGFETGTGGRGTLDYILMEQPRIPIGGVCSQASECDPMDATICVGLPIGTTPICTRSCDTDTTCPTGWCCALHAPSGTNVCATGDACIEPEPEPEPEPMTCACDATAMACDANCACDTDCGTVDPSGICSCDLTYSCDAAPGGGDCLCDPECDGGCGCASTEAEAATTPALMVAMVLLAFALRRRR